MYFTVHLTFLTGVRTIRSTGHQPNIEAAPIQGTCCNTPGSGVQESAVAYTPRFWMSNTKSSQEPEFSSPVARTQYHPNTYRYKLDILGLNVVARVSAAIHYRHN